MSGARLSRIVLNRGEEIYVSFGDSSEIGIWVMMREDGTCTIQGPVNDNRRTLRVTIDGIQEVPEVDKPEVGTRLGRRHKVGGFPLPVGIQSGCAGGLSPHIFRSQRKKK